MTDQIQIFIEDGFLNGSRVWGWQCFACRSEESRFGNASTAQEGADDHASICFAVNQRKGSE